MTLTLAHGPLSEDALKMRGYLCFSGEDILVEVDGEPAE